MFVLWFYDQTHTYFHSAFEDAQWFEFTMWRPGEGFWLVPGTDPEDPLYCWEC